MFFGRILFDASSVFFKISKILSAPISFCRKLFLVFREAGKFLIKLGELVIAVLYVAHLSMFFGRCLVGFSSVFSMVSKISSRSYSLMGVYFGLFSKAGNFDKNRVGWL